MNLYEQGALTLDGPGYHLAPEMPAHEFKKYTAALEEVRKEFRKKHRHESRTTQRLDVNAVEVDESEHVEVAPTVKILQETEPTLEQQGVAVSILFAILARIAKLKSAKPLINPKHWRRR